MISTSHLHRRSSKFVVFISTLLELPFETGLRFGIGDFREDSIRRKFILVYRKFLNKRAGASTFIMDFIVATIQLIRNIIKFDSPDFVTEQRTLRETSNFGPPEISKILDGQLHPEPLYRSRHDRGRLITRGVIISISALADALEDEESTSGGEGGGHVSPIRHIALLSQRVLFFQGDLSPRTRAAVICSGRLNWEGYYRLKPLDRLSTTVV